MPARREDILSAHAVMLVEQMTGIPDMKVPHRPTFAYPDGSLHYSAEGACDAMRFDMVAWGGEKYLHSTNMRSRRTVPGDRFYSIIYPAGYQKKLGDLPFGFSNTFAEPEFKEELQDPISVIVEFKRVPKTKDFERYMNYLRTWAKSVETQGIAGEGPARISSKDVGSSQRWAWFDVDMSKSGPNTMNWLVLVHLNFGIEVSPVTEVLFNISKDADPRDTRNLRESANYLPFWTSTVVSRSAVETISEDATPSESCDAEDYHWSLYGLADMQTPFPVEFDETSEWDSLEFTIQLVTNTTNDEREYLCDFLTSWLLLASRGAFGGRGTPCTEPPVFLNDGRTVRFRVDMGDLEHVASLMPFFRGLTHMHSELPIEAVYVK